MDTARFPVPSVRSRRPFPPLLLLGALAMNAIAAQTANFDSTPAGTLPEGWVAGVTTGVSALGKTWGSTMTRSRTRWARAGRA